jgi:DIS3-like exonuclease 1
LIEASTLKSTTKIRMIKSTKAFSRVNRQGKVVRITREHYVRDDIWCSSQLCTTCLHEQPILPTPVEYKRIDKQQPQKIVYASTTTVNTPTKKKKKKNAKAKTTTKPVIVQQQQQQQSAPTTDQPTEPIVHYVIPTVDSVLNYLEMFEAKQITNIIFCETVITEAQSQATLGKRLHHRIREIINDAAHRKSILFCNEHSKYTYIERNENESQKQRNQRAITTTAEWYRTHLSHHVPIVLLVMNGEEKKEIGDVSEGVTVMTIEEYINDSKYCAEKNEKSDLKNLYSSLTDSLKRKSESDSASLYEEHLSMETMESGIKNGLYIRGVIHVSKVNSQQAHVRLSAKGLSDSDDAFSGHTQLFVVGAADRNRALHGDVVAVQILPQSEWINDMESTEQKKPCGRVVGILQRNWRDYVACIQEQENQVSSDRYVLCVPLDYRIPRIRIMTRQKEQLADQRIVVRISSWESNSNYPNGFYVRTLGPIGDFNVESEGILIENQLDQVFKFTSQALAELPVHTPDNPYAISQREIQQRRDIRKSHMVVSVDPIGCEDIDDALSVRIMPNNNIEVGVHIADVSYYVKHGSNLDLEARAKSTTIYLVDRRLDMLPSLLSADLCSLRMDEDRLAVSVFWEFKSQTGEVVNTWFGRTVIRSKYALHYAQAQNIIDGKTAPKVPPTPGVNWIECDVSAEDLPQLKKYLTILQQFARKVRAARNNAGAIELESLDEVKIKLDESKEVKEIETKKDLEIHHTIAEWMIYANAAVAKKIYDSFPLSAILRRHPLPRMESFKALIQAAATRGFTIRTDTNAALAKSLETASDSNDPYVNLLLRSLATRAMSEAQYFSTGSFDPSEFYHYGLALQYYTHFTSPIRRYADVLAHRMLLLALEQEKNSQPHTNLIDNATLEEIAEHMNDRHRASKQAEGDSADWFRALYIKKKENMIEDGIIYSIKPNALYVFVPTYRIKTAVYITTKEGDLIVPEKEQREYKVIEHEPVSSISSNPTVSFNISFDENKLKLIVKANKKSPKKLTTVEYPFKIFDHVKVHLKTNDSRSHLPKVELELTSFSVNKKTGGTSSGKADFKKQYEEYEQMNREEEQLQQKKPVVQSGFEQSVDNVQTMLMNMRVTQPKPTIVSSSTATVPTKESSKYSQEELQKKLKAVTSRLKQIEQIKNKQQANQSITDEEEQKLATESKYIEHLKTLQKKLGM